jgi:hypothetical protein
MPAKFLRFVKFSLLGLLGIIGVALIVFGMYSAMYGYRIPQIRGLNLLVVPGAWCLVSSFFSIKLLICGYCFKFEIE